MYNALTIEQSLFFINNQYVEDFKQLAQEMESVITMTELPFLNLEATWCEAFNNWILLQPDETNIMEDSDKIFYYSSNPIFFGAMKNDYHFNNSQMYPNTTKEHLFILLLLLTENTNVWYDDLLLQHGLRDVLERNKQRDYYSSHLQNRQVLELFMNDQSLIVKALIQLISNTNTLVRLIKKSCDDANFLYEKTFLNSAIHSIK